jgi:hypothetical protein
MNRVTRQLLAFVSIAGGGLLGAAPVAAAAPSDPAPPPAPAATSDAPPNPVPAPDPSVRTGRAPAPGDATGSTGATPGGSVDPVRTGRAADLTTTGNSTTAPPSPAPPATDPSSPSPTPSTPTSPPRSGATASTPAANDNSASGAAPPPPSIATGPPPPDPTVHATVIGDDLWSIAAAQVAQASGRSISSLSNAEVAAYWQRVCDENRPHLQSGDVNLIYPGEQIALPPISG